MYKKDNNKGKHLTLEERMTILNELIKGTKLSDISNKIGKDPTTISKEIKFHRYSKNQIKHINLQVVSNVLNSTIVS